MSMGHKEFEATIAEIKELEAQQAEIADRIEALKDTVKAEMVKLGVDRMLVGTFKVNYTKYSTSRFDAKQFRADDELTYNKYVKTSEARRFSISKL